MTELNNIEMMEIDGGIAPLVVWIGYGLAAAAVGVVVGYVAAS